MNFIDFNRSFGDPAANPPQFLMFFIKFERFSQQLEKIIDSGHEKLNSPTCFTCSEWISSLLVVWSVYYEPNGINQNHSKFITFLLISQQPQNRSSPNFFPTFMGPHLNFHLIFMQFHAMGDPAAHPNWILMFFITFNEFSQQLREVSKWDLKNWILWCFLHVQYEFHLCWSFGSSIIHSQSRKSGFTYTPSINR